MRLSDLNEDQRIELKQHILMNRNQCRGEGTSSQEIADVDSLVSDEDLEKWFDGTEFSPDDFSCSATRTFSVRVTWPVSKVFQVPAKDGNEALSNMRRCIDEGNISCWDSGWEADDGYDVPKIEIEED